MSHKEKKLLLRDWLEVQLDSGRAMGIEWVQKETGIFKMVWRHANNPIWHEEDGWIYRVRTCVFVSAHKQTLTGRLDSTKIKPCCKK
jgi:hypothetical protein